MRTSIVLLSCALVILAGGFLATTAHVLMTSPQEVPIADQWGVVHAHLLEPFPANLLCEFNGHLPVFTGLFWLADLHLFSASNRFSLLCGVLAFVAALGILGSILVRDGTVPLALRCSFLASLGIAITWLVHAPNLACGSECIFIGLPLLATSLLLLHLSSAQPKAWALIGLCTLAAFSHGFGLVLWPLAILLAWLRGASRRLILLSAASAAITVVFYVAVTPRDAIAVTLDLTRVWSYSGAWLSGPFFHAAVGLGLADRSAVSAWEPCATLLGFAGLTALSTWLVLVARARPVGGGSDLVALGAALLGAGIAALIGVTRGPHFEAHPMEIFAPRYQLWPCLFWWGLSVRISRSLWTRGELARMAVLAVGLLASISLVPAQLMSGRLHRESVQRQRVAALALVVGVDDRASMRTLTPIRWNLDYVAPWLRERGAGVFDWELSRRLGSILPPVTGAEVPGAIESLDVLPGISAGEGLEFAGWVAGVEIADVVVADAQRRICGLGAVLPRSRTRNVDAPSRTEIAGFVRDFVAGEPYSFHVLFGHGRVSPPLRVSARAPRVLFLVEIDTLLGASSPMEHRFGTPLPFRLEGHRAGQPTALFVTEAAGQPCLLPLWSGLLGEGGKLVVTLPMPQKALPLEFVVTGWTIDANQGLVQSPRRRIYIH